MLKKFLVTPLFLASCQGGVLSESGDDELLNLKPLQVQTFKKNADETWNNETRLAYAGYYYLIGEYLSLEHNSTEAESVLELANELDPNEFLAFKVLYAKLTSGKEDEARGELQRLILLYPNSARLHSLYGAFLAKSGNFDLAVSQLEKAINLEPTDEKAYLHLIGIYQQKNDSAKTLRTAIRFGANVPRSAQGQLILARTFQELGKTPETLKHARQAYQLAPYNAEIALLYAQQLEATGEMSAAIEIYDQLFSENPSLEELLGKTVALYRTYGDLNEVYKRLVSMGTHSHNRSIGIEIQKALILWELGRNQEALDGLLQLQTVYPDSEQVTYLTGLAFEKMGDLKSALALYEKVSEASSFYLPANYQALRVMEAQKHLDQAQKLIQKLTSSRYVISEIYSIGANLYARENKFEDAIKLLEDGFRKFPEQIDLLFLTGVFQEKAGRIDDCVRSMREVIHKDPNNSAALNYLGYIWAERGKKLDLAKALIERALSLKPNDGFYLDSLGWVYYQKGEYDKALEVLTNASKSQPDEGIIVEHIGDVYLKMNKKNEAEQTFEQALKKSTLDPRDKERIEQKLNRLKENKDI